jgi:hypothetical protein
MTAVAVLTACLAILLMVFTLRIRPASRSPRIRPDRMLR